MPASHALVDSQTGTNRISEMDSLRGFALLGICIVNLTGFALPLSNSVDFPAGESATEITAWIVLALFFLGKTFSLFSILFGMGIAIQFAKAAKKGDSFSFQFVKRMLFLTGLGILHALLLFLGDILFVYSIAGIIGMTCRNLGIRILCGLAIILFSIGAFMSAWTASTSAIGSNDQNSSQVDPDTVTRIELPDDFSKIDPSKRFEYFDEINRKAFDEGPIGFTLAFNVYAWKFWLVFSSFISFNYRVLAFVLLGIVWIRRQMWSSEFKRFRERLVLVGMPIGLALKVIGITIEILAHPVSSQVEVAVTLLDEIAAILITFGYLGMISIAYSRGWFSRFLGLVANAGRMSLTNYLSQSIVACVLFRWYGFGLWGDVSRFGLLFLGIGIWSTQIVLSSLWLSRFKMGPMEWVWRKATYGKKLK